MAAAVDLPYLLLDTDRHGNPRAYFRKRGSPRIRLRAAIGSPEFLAEYAAARERHEAGRDTDAVAQTASNRPLPGTFRAMAVGYLGSQDFLGLNTSTQRARRGIIESMWVEPRKPGAVELMGECPIGLLTVHAIEMLRDRKADKPAAARERLKALSAIFKWALRTPQWKALGVNANPAREVERIRYVTDGFHSWTDEEVAAFEDRWRLGTTAHLALQLLLLTGQRRSDVVRFGKQHIKQLERQREDGETVRETFLSFTQTKNAKRHPTRLELPVLPELQRVLAASPCGDLTFLVTSFGRPFSAAGFGNAMREWCNQAGLPHCTAHGLRKAGARRAAELGATEYQMCAIFGWKNPAEASTYIKAARQKRMAQSAMHMLAGRNA
jgi:integrase